MKWEPGYREVPATDPPDYEPPDDGDWWHGEWTDAARELSDAEQDEAERAHETYYQPTEGDRGGPDASH